MQNLSNKKYYEKNKDKILKRHKEYKQSNKEKIKEKNKLYRQKNREEISAHREDYFQNNPEKYEKHLSDCRKRNKINREKYKPFRNALLKKRRQEDKAFALQIVLRSRVYDAIKHGKGKKYSRSLELLGCSLEEVRTHLENQFKEGMSWDNHTIDGWHIDHIKPCASFDLTLLEEQKKCFHYTNLQPLWAKDNIVKGSK